MSEVSKNELKNGIKNTLKVAFKTALKNVFKNSQKSTNFSKQDNNVILRSEDKKVLNTVFVELDKRDSAIAQNKKITNRDGQFKKSNQNTHVSSNDIGKKTTLQKPSSFEHQSLKNHIIISKNSHEKSPNVINSHKNTVKSSSQYELNKYDIKNGQTQVDEAKVSRFVHFVRNLKYFGKVNNLDFEKIQKIDYKSMFSSYPDSIKTMNKYIHSAMLNGIDTVWFLEYGPCYTFGLSSIETDMDFLNKVHIPSYKSNRGGRVTYHGPGQLIVYFIVNLKERKMDYSDLLKVIQFSTIDCLKDFGASAHESSDEYPDAVGIWVKNEKIASIGLRIQNGCSHHGIAINIFPDMGYFDYIVPCGLNGVNMTSLEKLGLFDKKRDINDFCDVFERCFVKNLAKLSR